MILKVVIVGNFAFYFRIRIRSEKFTIDMTSYREENSCVLKTSANQLKKEELWSKKELSRSKPITVSY